MGPLCAHILRIFWGTPLIHEMSNSSPRWTQLAKLSIAPHPCRASREDTNRAFFADSIPRGRAHDARLPVHIGSSPGGRYLLELHHKKPVVMGSQESSLHVNLEPHWGTPDEQQKQGKRAMTNRESNSNTPNFEHLVDIANKPQASEATASAGQSGAVAKVVGALRCVMDSLRVAGPAGESAIQQATSFPGAFASRLGVDKLGAGLAHLVSDTRGVVLAGYRGAASTYALTFEADGVEIHLEVTPVPVDGGAAEIQAHIDTGGDDTMGTVHFQKVLDAGEATSAAIDDGGYASVSLPLGTYDAVIELAGRNIVVPAVELG